MVDMRRAAKRMSLCVGVIDLTSLVKKIYLAGKDKIEIMAD